ncbi:MAG TPA: hypothetical protein VJV78_11030 [Polyangiales bacterium]|nr:hypothetical protein [Polyangiales bacterium]
MASTASAWASAIAAAVKVPAAAKVTLVVPVAVKVPAAAKVTLVVPVAAKVPVAEAPVTRAAVLVAVTAVQVALPAVPEPNRTTS